MNFGMGTRGAQTSTDQNGRSPLRFGLGIRMPATTAEVRSAPIHLTLDPSPAPRAYPVVRVGLGDGSRLFISNGPFTGYEGHGSIGLQ